MLSCQWRGIPSRSRLPTLVSSSLSTRAFVESCWLNNAIAVIMGTLLLLSEAAAIPTLVPRMDTVEETRTPVSRMATVEEIRMVITSPEGAEEIRMVIASPEGAEETRMDIISQEGAEEDTISRHILADMIRDPTAAHNKEEILTLKGAIRMLLVAPSTPMCTAAQLAVIPTATNLGE